MKEHILKIEKQVERNVINDPDVSTYASRVSNAIHLILKGSEIKETEKTSQESNDAIRTLIQFQNTIELPGGSRSDYIGSAVVKAFQGYEIVSIGDEITEDVICGIGEMALYPDRELETLKPFMK